MTWREKAKKRKAESGKLTAESGKLTTDFVSTSKQLNVSTLFQLSDVRGQKLLLPGWFGHRAPKENSRDYEPDRLGQGD